MPCGRARIRADPEAIATGYRAACRRGCWTPRSAPPCGASSTPPASIVHTNLGRAPLGDAAVRAHRARSAGGYTNLEYDLDAGRRGARDTHAEALLCRLTGAEAAVVVNNCAAATMLVLAALARGREVVISRGELVEIGGGFRVPDVMAQSGARLREVGTTNRTRAADYALAISEQTGAILRVHPSNFRIEGFVERAPLAELVALGRRFSVPVIEDLGSGFTPIGPSRRPAACAGADAFNRASRRAWTSSVSAATSCSAARRPASSSGARRCCRRSAAAGACGSVDSSAVAPDDDAGLRAAEQLVAAEADDVRARCDALLHAAAPAPAVRRVTARRREPAAQILDDRDREPPARALPSRQGAARSVNPSMRKLDGCTRRISAGRARRSPRA